MCGICGTFGEDTTHITSIMLSALLHRGPDGNAIQEFPWGSLGFCRLDIFGPSGVDQPAISSDHQTAVVFNGEIYNYHQLVTLPGLPTKVRSEAELILHLFLVHGEECFKYLKGMFAVAIMTPEKVLLARDSLGIKPLVYYIRGGVLHFASEIKALLRIQIENPGIDHEAMAETAVFGFIQDLEKTMFKGIRQVPPGSYLRFGGDKVEVLPFFQIRPAYRGPEVWDEVETLERLNSLLTTAAGLYVNHSKHSQAVYLSGGIDSTLMTYFLRLNSQDKLYSYTLYDDVSCEDRPYASLVANEFSTIHSEHLTGPDECLSTLRHYLYHYESLVSDGIFNVLGSLAFHILSKVISREHKVAYCGEGADELFGGYYWAHTHPLGLGDRLRGRSNRVKDGRTQVHEYILATFPDDDSKQERMRESIFNLLMGPGLTNCHLWSVDRSSSAFSIEARPLYLWDDIRDWALSLSIENKVSKDRDTKLILKRFADGLGNDHVRSISRRRKIGMPSALRISLAELVPRSEARFKEAKHKGDRPHRQYEGYFFTDIEKFLFDEFYTIFIINRGRALADQ